MPRHIRFTALVKQRGRPQTVILWSKPEDNPSFVKAVREHRVLTVIQKPTGNQKDFGIIGFHQERFALYLVFLKPLLEPSGTRVIGIDYDLIEKADPLAGGAKKALSRRRLFPSVVRVVTAIPIKRFRVRLLRVATEEIALTLRGATIHEAEAAALRKIQRRRIKPQDVHTEIKSIAEA